MGFVFVDWGEEEDEKTLNVTFGCFRQRGLFPAFLTALLPLVPLVFLSSSDTLSSPEVLHKSPCEDEGVCSLKPPAAGKRTTREPTISGLGPRASPRASREKALNETMKADTRQRSDRRLLLWKRKI